MTDAAVHNLIRSGVIAAGFIIMYIYHAGSFEPKKKNPAARIAFYTAAYFLCTACVLFVDNSLFGFASYIFFSETLCLLFFKTTFKESMLYNFLWCLYLNFCDVLATTSVSFMLGVSTADIVKDHIQFLLSSLICVMLMILVYKICMILMTKHRFSKTRLSEGVFILFLMAFQFTMLYLITILTFDTNSAILLVTTVCFIILDIYITYMLRVIEDGYKNKYELDSMKMQNRIQLDHYEELNRKYAETRCMMHDIEKHISAIERLARSRNFAEAQDYTEKLRGELEKYGAVFECRNKILGAVLSQKIKLAEEKGITVTAEIEDLTLDFMDETDITAIFANLMDNATEACEETEDRHISLKMCRINDLIFIDMQNSYSGKLSQHGGDFLTTKSGHLGCGMTSIKMSAEKYGGFMIAGGENGSFTTELVIPAG